MLTRALTWTIETGPVPVTVDVYRDDGRGSWGPKAILAATGTPVRIEAAPGNRLRFGEREAGFGGGVLASFIEFRLLDPDGAVRQAFTRLRSETDFLVVVTAPEHVLDSGTRVPAFVWYGRPMRAAGVRTIAPAVYPEGAVKVRVYDGLGGLARREALPTQGETVAGLLRRLQAGMSRHLPLIFAPDAWPTNAGQGRNPEWLRFAPSEEGEAAGRGRGDYGDPMKQLEALCSDMGLVAFQHTTPGVADPQDPLSAGPALWVVHRSYVGGAVPLFPSRYEPGEGAPREIIALGADSLPLRPEDVGAAEEGLEEVLATARVRIQMGQADLVRQPFGGELALGERDEQDLLAVTAEAGVRLRIRARFAAYNRGSGVYEPLGRLSLLLDTRPFSGPDGAVYHLDADGRWGAGLPILRPPNGSSNTLWLDVAAGEDFPAIGRLRLSAVGETREYEGYERNAVITDVSVTLEDAAGHPITDYVITVAGALPDGETTEFEAASAYEALLSSTEWEPATVWRSRIYTAEGVLQSFDVLDAYRAHDRLAQQGRDLAAPICTVYGLHGPGRRLVFPASLLQAEEPVPCLATGLEIDLDRAATTGAWCEATTSAIEP